MFIFNASFNLMVNSIPTIIGPLVYRLSVERKTAEVYFSQCMTIDLSSNFLKYLLCSNLLKFLSILYRAALRYERLSSFLMFGVPGRLTLDVGIHSIMDK